MADACYMTNFITLRLNRQQHQGQRDLNENVLKKKKNLRVILGINSWSKYKTKEPAGTVIFFYTFKMVPIYVKLRKMCVNLHLFLVFVPANLIAGLSHFLRGVHRG